MRLLSLFPLHLSPAPWLLRRAPEKLPTWQYDLQELRKAATQLLVGIGFTTLLVYKFEIRQVLILQAIFALRGLYSNQLVQIHLLGRPATGDLKRPFKAPNPLAYARERSPNARAGVYWPRINYALYRFPIACGVLRRAGRCWRT